MMKIVLQMWFQWLLQAIAPAAGGWFTKQADFLTAANLNDVNDATVGGQIQSVPSAVPATQGIQTLPGDRIILDDATAYALSDTAVGTLYGGIYMYVLSLSSSTASPAVGAIAFWRSADIGSTTTTPYIATADAQPLTTTPAYILGIWINAATKGNACWVQIAGIASVLFDSTVTSTTSPQMVSAKNGPAVASTADNGVALTQAIYCYQIGVSVGTVTTSTVSKVSMLRGFGRL
jgi:hypothetical protein